MSKFFPNFKISINVSDITTPYVFFIKDPFDFQPEEANFHRMILQAEEQRSVRNKERSQSKLISFSNKLVPILLLGLGLTKMVIGIKVVSK